MNALLFETDPPWLITYIWIINCVKSVILKYLILCMSWEAFANSLKLSITTIIIITWLMLKNSNSNTTATNWSSFRKSKQNKTMKSTYPSKGQYLYLDNLRIPTFIRIWKSLDALKLALISGLVSGITGNNRKQIFYIFYNW